MTRVATKPPAAPTQLSESESRVGIYMAKKSRVNSLNHFVLSHTFESMPADAGVLAALAFAAGAEVEREAEVLRFRVRLLLELHDEVVAVAFGELGLGDERVALLLELQRRLAGLGVALPVLASAMTVTVCVVAATGFIFSS